MLVSDWSYRLDTELAEKNEIISYNTHKLRVYRLRIEHMFLHRNKIISSKVNLFRCNLTWCFNFTENTATQYPKDIFSIISSKSFYLNF